MPHATTKKQKPVFDDDGFTHHRSKNGKAAGHAAPPEPVGSFDGWTEKGRREHGHLMPENSEAEDNHLALAMEISLVDSTGSLMMAAPAPVLSACRTILCLVQEVFLSVVILSATFACILGTARPGKNGKRCTNPAR